MKAFENIIGQAIAKGRLIESLQSASNGGEFLQPFMIGEAGLGKSKLNRAYCEAARELGFDVLSFESPEEFRSEGPAFDSIMQIFEQSDKFVIHIGETHLFKQRNTVRMDKLFAFLMKCLDKGNYGKAIRFDDNRTFTFSPKRGSFVFDTNFPHLLDKSGAFQSRLDTMVLDKYTEEELVQILQVMLIEAGFQEANEGTLGMIARCGRGTARPMEHIVSQLKITRHASGEARKSINKADVLNALLKQKMYPRGLQTHEIQILNRIHKPLRDNVLSASMHKIEKAVFNESKGFLINQALAAPTPQGLQLTDFGKTYLATAAKEGFPVNI